MQLRYHPFHMSSFCSNSLTMLSVTYVHVAFLSYLDLWDVFDNVWPEKADTPCMLRMCVMYVLESSKDRFDN